MYGHGNVTNSTYLGCDIGWGCYWSF